MSNHAALIVGGEIAPKASALANERGLALTSCKSYPSEDELVEAANAIRAQALILRMGTISRGAIERIPTLKVIAKHGVGYDTIDIAAAADQGVIVLVAGGANALSVAEQALALLLSVARSTAWLDRRLRAGEWDKSTYTGVEITGRSIGLIGLGVIGRTFLDLLKPFNMTVRIYDPYLADDQIPVGAERVETVDALLTVSDIVSLHCPLTEQNRNLIDATALATMNPDAILINTARGALVDQDALFIALRDGIIRGAGLDTFAKEPTSADNPLWTLPNIVGSPHVGANTVEARDRVGMSCVDQIVTYLAHGEIDARNHVNRAVKAAA
ncbi:hydroxyacid dehydrogenase [Sphingobium sp. WCS2017Hpa-17]|uniref:hydroxyacid dehydrogenase n=1 Tax=Sphingobium sp. WCS2017Hpa-17 TaxID=3073638 RepID=UPI00288A051F|nr:hydroxyacid dehydrogenase [Sphingobium sp. WCS2017Hpa-17]